MLFENFDKKIKEAAEQHHPPYDEKAWQKMDKLLGQHMPREKNRGRRLIFFLLIFLLIGGGAFFMIAKPWTKNTVSADLLKPEAVKPASNAVAESKKTNPSNGASSSSKTPGAGTTRSVPKSGAVESTSELDQTAGSATSRSTLPKSATRNDQQKTALNTSKIDKKNRSVLTKNPGSDPEIITSSPLVIARDNEIKSSAVQKEQSQVTSSADVQKVNTAADGKPLGKAAASAIDEPQKQNETAKTTSAKKTRKSVQGGLVVFVAAGPDVSKAGSSKTGQAALAYGVGLAYKINRFTVKSGVFTAKKVYWAGASDYDINYAPPANVKFQGADAQCDVIEVPVRITYDFAVGKKSSWFAGAGLSSYFMKRENYVYYYKSPTGSYTYPYEVKNENKHYFSVLNLSAGYSYQLSRKVSISAEPYLELPLRGVGMGKVHLNSGGVLFTVGVKPFGK